ncbi:FMN-linked oxidoreductase [Pleurotus eryngii]|uniref:FMN-linked oxidoreductase n=1 Tax=Pleurotus eryngii TaxID=5323 RepID=A0A9P5ZHJ4_PLEER|nr:FMN-linked oxidoreductase [Pleurotus eryngii]
MILIFFGCTVGGIFTRGPGLSIIEATSVVPEGRVTPSDSGLWSDDQIAPLAEIVQFAHSQNQPNAMTKKGIWGLIRAFVEAARRTLKAGFDDIDVHGAHGYLIHTFLSPVSNHRTGEYGGSFENRTRLALEVVVRLARKLAEHSVDLLDVSSGGMHPKQKISSEGPMGAYQAPFSGDVKKSVAGDGSLLVSAVGLIKSGFAAQHLLEAGFADIVFVGRHFQKNPGAVWAFAEVLGVDINLAHQISWPVKGRGGRGSLVAHTK